MKPFIKTLLFLILPICMRSQNTFFYTPDTKQEADSLGLILQTTKNDVLKMSLYKDLAFFYSEINRDSSLFFAEQQLALANKLGQKLWQAAGLTQIGYLAQRLNNYPKSLVSLTEAAKIAEEETNESACLLPAKFSGDGDAHHARLVILSTVYQQTGFLFGVLGINERAPPYYQKALKIAQIFDDKVSLGDINMNFGEFYLRAKKPDSAYIVEKTALQYSEISGYKQFQGFMLRVIGQAFLQKGKLDSAKIYLLEAVQASQIQQTLADEADSYIPLAELYKSAGQSDSSLFYAKKSLKIYQKVGVPAGMNNAYASISAAYQLQGKVDSAFLYLKIAKAFGDSLSKAEIQKIYQFQNIDFSYKIKLQEAEKKQADRLNTLKFYGLLGALALFSFAGLFLYRNNRQKQQVNEALQQQKQKVESALSQLKATQTQLVQSEKLASLGELTAGIAHEIQNPLNFVTNFSELSVDLAKELQEEIEKPDLDKDLVKDLAADLSQNQEKINHHGKRASSIVKGMLEHSRASTRIKEPTDVNALADEYLRLAYHGLRAKDKDFNATMETHFDAALPKINIIPQDIGRVILNLVNNAFYAVTQRTKRNVASYEPTVTVSTQKLENGVEVRVKDNGTGMPETVKAKIFQPFFTTKPTGQGTGLGLSLAYDIVTKGHGGSLTTESAEGVGTEFVIFLPFKTNGS